MGDSLREYTANKYYLLVIILLLTSFGFSEEVLFFQNNGGLNSKSSPVNIKDNEGTDLLNINLDTDGAIKKRSGYINFGNQLSHEINGLAEHVLANQTRYMMACARGIYKMDSVDGTWDDVTGTTNLTVGNNVYFNRYNDIMLMTNNTDRVQQWNGVSNATDNDVYNDINLESAQDVANYKDRVFLANVVIGGVRYPNRVYYSDIGDVTVWNGDNFYQIGNDARDSISRIINFGGYLYVVKKRSVWRLRATGDTTIPFNFERTYATEGCISPGSLQEIENVLIYLSNKGIVMFDGNRSEVISYRIQPTIDAFDQSVILKAQSGVYRELNQYWLSIENDSTADRVIIFDYYNKAFLLHNGINASALLSIRNTSQEEVFVTGDADGYAYLQDEGLNDYPNGVATAIDAYFTTKHYHFNTIANSKILQNVILLYELQQTQGDLSVSYSYNLSTESFETETAPQQGKGAEWDTSDYDIDVYAEFGASYYRIDTKDRGVAVSLKFRNSELSQTFSIYGWALRYSQSDIIRNNI